MNHGTYANVIIDISHEKVDRPFQYRIPDSLKEKLAVGMCVQIPFGTGNRKRKGYVIEITGKNEYPEEKIKEIDGIITDNLPAEADAIRLAAWMRQTYGSTMIAALKTVLPVKRAVKAVEKKKLRRSLSAEELTSLLGECMRKHQNAKARVLQELLTEEELPYELVTGKLHVSAATLNSLVNQGAITIESESSYRNPVSLNVTAQSGPELSEEQCYIKEQILSDYDKNIRNTYLIHGITGSGKTLVYLALIEEMIKRGKQCIVLIPEIALTYQTLLRFYKRFGERVSVMNSSLSQGERFDQCERARKGEIDVMIGPRSALFVPFPNLGMIVIDEEHEGSYISENAPRYHARETAEYLASLKKASLVLGSATPSLEAYYKAKKGEYRLFTMKNRKNGGELANVRIVDLRQELRKGNRSIFSSDLQELIRDRLGKKQQIMLFLNRRGYAGFVSCRSCGYVMKCPHCDVSLSQHIGGKMVCHYCGYETVQPKRCPNCSSNYILGFKAGTQQIERQLYELFPGIRVLRMDGDTTKQKGSFEKILSAFAEGEADVLLGTQMIVKGHDFPNVTLVGVLAADLSLNDSDYRAGEKTFQLLTQAEGRAGRGMLPGEAIIQTYRPEHYSIQQAAKQDYEAFYEEEILYRELLEYPPAGHMLTILVVSKDEKRCKGLAVRLAKEAGAYVHVIGPTPAAVSKVKDYYRYMIYLKSLKEEPIRQAKERLEALINGFELKTENVIFDYE
ncbi:primosomal protein N' PriA [Firmicutes bacterium CAG:95]|nr:primosomal protein N' PriA [Firmicutes bacterium CAG:95]